MNDLTTRFRFAIVGDELEVSAPPALEPLDDFFETEIGTGGAMLDLVEHHVQHDRTWRFTGNSCHLLLDGETATVTHSHTGTRATLTRAALRVLLADLRALLES